MTHYDVVVVGAGPAGSAAAISMADLGWRVVLIDKATFPRDKVCGDFLSPRSLKVLEALGCLDTLRQAQPHAINRSMVHLNGELISTGPVPQVADLPGYGLVVRRVVLDEIIFRRAEAAGAEIVEGVEATGLSISADGITVHGRGTTGPRSVTGRLAIIADGAHSRLAPALGLTPTSGKKDPFALRAYYKDVPSDPNTSAIFFDTTYFPGYAWLFPTGDGGANVGMGMVMDVSRRYGINLREQFVRWLERDPGLRDLLHGACLDGRIVGWPLSTYQGTHGNYADRVLVVGDAGRFIDPINGEGIHTALESARIASSVADEALATGDLSAASLRTYERRWRSAFDLDLRTSDLMATVAKNRALLPLWSLIIRMVAERSMIDPRFAATCGGIMAGVIPSHQGISPELAVKALLQRPGFWLRHRKEVFDALAALLIPGSGGSWSTADTSDPPRRSESDVDWVVDVMSKASKVSDGLTRAYGAPWAVAPRLRASRRP